MSVGLPKGKNDIDYRAGQIVVQLRDILEAVDNFKLMLDAYPDVDMEAAGWTPTEVAVMKSAYGDLAKLSRISKAQDTQIAVSDFMFWARKLTGVQ
jgi:hypothetical protein